MDFLRHVPRRRLHFFALQAAFAAVIISVAVTMLYVARQTIRKAAEQQADNIANILQRDLEREIDIADLALRHVQVAIPLLSSSTVAADAERAILFSSLKVSGRPGTMLVVDEHGTAIFDSGSPSPRQHRQYAERDWFTTHRDHDDAGLLMTLVPHTALDQQPALVLSRRINHADGTFAGVVGASLDPALFEDLFQSVALTPGSNIYILTVDGRLIYGRIRRTEGFGTDYSEAPVSRALREAPGPVFIARSITGEDRLYAQHRLRNLPLRLFVGLSVHDIFHAWWIEAESVGAIIMALSAAALALLTRLRRELVRSASAEATAKQSESRYRTLADRTTDVITCLDLEFRRTYVSPSCRTVFGYAPEELLSNPLVATVHPEDRWDTRTKFESLANGELDAERVTNRFRHKLGHYVWVEANLALVREPETSKPASIVCSIRDISIRKAQADQLLAANRELDRLSRHYSKARDAAERANRAKSRFLASISHELRTPLNGILGYAELMRIDGELSSTQEPRVDAMLAAGMHLLQLINCVLDLTEMESGHIELRPAATNLRALAAGCLEFVRPSAAAKGLSLEVRVAPVVPVHVMVDATRLRQILLNLLGNAVKFTRAGSVTLQIGMDVAPLLQFEVVDTGIGIPPEKRDLLFQEFSRLAAEGLEPVEGTGLGLALSARLAALMDGVIGHMENPGGGSIFKLTLAAAAAAPDDARTPEATLDAALPAHVLVVDDVAANRDVAASFLRAAGHRVECADSGEHAVRLAAETLFDVILMDVRMPEMDGLEASRRIRAFEGAFAAVPIVALTAQAFTQHVEECRQAGMEHHLAKPYSQSELLAVIAKARSNSLSNTTARTVGDGEALAGETALLGANLPVMDQRAYDETTRFLSAERLAAAISALICRTSQLLQDLRAKPVDTEALVGAAHSLAGCAGIFGFQRLAAVGQRLEYAVDYKREQVPLVIESLGAAATLSLDRMRMLAAADSGGE